MEDQDAPKPSLLSRFPIRDTLVFGAGAALGAVAIYAGYRFDPVPAVVRLTKDELQLLIDNPEDRLLSKGYKGAIAIVRKDRQI